MKKVSIFAVLLVLVFALSGCAVKRVTVKNPIIERGADPWLVEHNGTYYYCYTDSVGNGVRVAKSDSIHTMKADGNVIYAPPAGTEYSEAIWAPELHYLNGEWYIYVAASNGEGVTHRMYVLKGTTQDPTDPFEMVGQITDSTNKWAIDGTVFQHKGELYFIWSGWAGDYNVAQNIYIAHMSDPCTIDSERVLLSIPDHTWERQGNPDINEGPVILKHEDDIFLVYSASGSWLDSYCLGMLAFQGDDPMNAAHWKKFEEPVFKKKDGLAYGPGHCSFTTAADGSIWMIYHAIMESGGGWESRAVWIAPVSFDKEGTPIFGEPEGTVRFPVATGK